MENKKDALPQSHLEGVFTAQKKNGEIYYRSSLTFRGKHISLGSFDTPQKAHRAYTTGRLLLMQKNANLLSYSPGSILPFEKWVILLNFRDHNMYFSTPIYMGAKMFFYYLSPDKILKFDLDDLFYYSSHKIMQRGGHLFLADYGSQINLPSRYGIKAYAVEGKDYIFKNGDNLDYRRHNLEIYNQYHGVEYIAAKQCYQAKIHVKGYYHIGDYENALIAAIAYNKAIDTLKRNGCTKEYTPNFIDEIPASAYADIYSGLSINEKLLTLSFSSS